MDNVPVGGRTIIVQKDGYQDASTTITVKKDEVASVDFELIYEKANIKENVKLSLKIY